MKPQHFGLMRPQIRLRLGAPVWIAAAAVVLLLLASVLARGLVTGNAQPAGGKLAAESTTFDFGRVSMSAGLLKTKFPLTVQGSPVVTNLATN